MQRYEHDPVTGHPPLGEQGMDNRKQPVEGRLHIQEEHAFPQGAYRPTLEESLLALPQDGSVTGSERGEKVDVSLAHVAVILRFEG